MKIQNKNEIVVCVSGGFQVLHLGHIRLFKEAKKLGTKLVVLLNNDNWLLLKKGIVNVNENARKEIIESIRYVDEVIISSHEKGTNDMSICNDLSILNPDIFANGGDRFVNNIPEYKLCKDMNIQMTFGVGGGKIDSSTNQLNNIKFSKYFKLRGNIYIYETPSIKIHVEKVIENKDTDEYNITFFEYDELLSIFINDSVINIIGTDNMLEYVFEIFDKHGGE